MADTLNESNDKQERRDIFAEVPVPTFDPVTPEGRKARWALLITSLITLVCLLAAIVSEHYTKPWRIYQRRFGDVLAAQARARGKRPVSFPQEVKQVTVQAFDVVDRCTTCHVGIDDPSMFNEDQPFRAHPKWAFDIHSPDRFGCTTCHGGQGLATTAEDAHGYVEHWEDPMIPKDYYQAGCGSCHTHIKVHSRELADYGLRLFERNDCFACHRINGRGRGNGPDLSAIGAKRPRTDWHTQHLALKEQVADEQWLQSYGPLEQDEVFAINAFLDQLMQAPQLVEAKAVVYENGCLGCHRINGVGGDDGPDLSGTGKKNLARLDFSNISGDRNLANWHKAHLKNPGLIVPNSQMPQPDLAGEELEAATLYMLSLRGADVPMSRWPPARFEAERLGVRDFPQDGESLFKAFCISCHGEDGMGTRFGISPQAFPAVAHPEFLEVASDRFIRENLFQGRPGRRMPSWGTKEAGLKSSEIEALARYLRSFEPSAPEWIAVSNATPDKELGRRLYRENCAMCHGASGEGAIGPALSNPVFLATVEPKYIHTMIAEGREETAMGSQATLDAHEMASIIAHVLNWRQGKTMPLPELPEPGPLHLGEAVFSASCSPCHGARGQGNLSANLVSPAFLEAASDGFMAAAVKYGRCAPPESAPPGVSAPEVTDQQLADAIHYIRERLGPGIKQPPGRLASGDTANGRELFSEMCAGCHGADGRGGGSPELTNLALLASATDGYLQASILRGRPSAGMPAFGKDSITYRKLTAEEVSDIVKYLRSFESGS
jgi:mono/diheme cytochrome c family protein